MARWDRPLDLVLVALYLALIIGAIVSDVRARRVGNRTNLALFSVVLLAAVIGTSPAGGVVRALSSMLIGFGCWIGFWILGVLGAGDVKFFAAAAGWFLPAVSWRLAVLAALLGGVLAFLWTMRQRGIIASFRSVVLTVRHPDRARLGEPLPDVAVRSFPYAVPMAIALVATALFPQLPYLLITPR
jgi:prepilin peptidase CpaA